MLTFLKYCIFVPGALFTIANSVDPSEMQHDVTFQF